MNDLQVIQQRCNQNNWRNMQRWLRRTDRLPIDWLLAGYRLDQFGVPTPPCWLTGRHRYAVLLYLLSLSTHAEKIRVLDLKGLSIPCLPDCLAAFPQLMALYLDNNGLRSLPPSICRVQHLQVLSLGRNRIKRLPIGFSRLWLSLRKLYLGHNQIERLPFHQDDMLITQGCIGQNQLTEPVGERWMLRSDVALCKERLLELFAGTMPTSDGMMQMFVEQGVALCVHLDDPMIYELLFHGVRIDTSGVIHWSTSFERSVWAQYAALRLLSSINRGSIVDTSLYRQHIYQLDLRGQRFVAAELGQLPCLQQVVVSSDVVIPSSWIDKGLKIVRA